MFSVFTELFSSEWLVSLHQIGVMAARQVSLIYSRAVVTSSFRHTAIQSGREDLACFNFAIPDREHTRIAGREVWTQAITIRI